MVPPTKKLISSRAARALKDRISGIGAGLLEYQKNGGGEKPSVYPGNNLYTRWWEYRKRSEGTVYIEKSCKKGMGLLAAGSERRGDFLKKLLGEKKGRIKERGVRLSFLEGLRESLWENFFRGLIQMRQGQGDSKLWKSLKKPQGERSRKCCGEPPPGA